MAEGSQPSARNKAVSPKRRGDRLTPAMAQYMEMKAAYPDALLFFRMGDFYEMFFEDAKEAAAALNLTLTKRGHHAGEDVPMCGVPVRTAEVYLARLIRAGFNVAVCEQTEDVETAKRERGPSATLRRAVVRLVTPGTLYEDALLDSRSSAYLAAIARDKRGGDVAIAAAELSTGRFILRSVPADAFASELAELAPAEIVAPPDLLSDEAVRSAIAACPSQPNLTERPARDFTPKSGEARLKDALGVAAIEAHGAFAAAELAASGGLIAYIAHTQVDEPPRLSPPTRGADGERLQIDPATRASLELLRTQRGERAGSVLDAIDRTVTGAGARLLAARLAAPLAQLGAINRRLDAVAHFKDQADLRAAARDLLKGAPDLARALGRLDLGKAGPRDLLAVREALACAADLARLLDGPPEPSGIGLETPADVAGAAQALRASRQFPELLGTLQRALEPEAPLAA
ncbi:MAG: DNA mismatch repair protein MutS, partial [Pseudomonadota bacterium]